MFPALTTRDMNSMPTIEAVTLFFSHLNIEEEIDPPKIYQKKLLHNEGEPNEA